MKRIAAAAVLLLVGQTSVFADGVGIGAGQDETGKIFFVFAHGKNSQDALDKARELCIAKYQNCTPLVQYDKGCVTLVAGASQSGVQIFQGATRQEALMSCSVGGADCVPPLESLTECVR